MSDIWFCLTCRQPGPEPAMRLLDGNYGSERCHSSLCKHQKRIFHKEATEDGSTHPPVSERGPER